MVWPDQYLEPLKAEFGERYEVWYVPSATGGGTWCAKLRGVQGASAIHGRTPDELRAALVSAEKGVEPAVTAEPTAPAQLRSV